MALTEAEVRKLLSVFVGDNKATMLGKCVSIDKANCTCVIDDDGVEVYDVRLRAITGANDGIVRYPKKDAYVLAVKIESTDEWMMLEATQYDSVLVLCDKIMVNEGANGGMVISQKVVDEIIKTITRVNAIVTSLNTLATAMTAMANAPVLGAALGTAITTATTALQTPLSNPAASALENEKFKH